MKLTKIQLKHFKSIDWLLDENNRREGRTMLLALVYIKQALEGRKIKIIDHAFIAIDAGYRVNKMLAEYIEEIITKEKIPLKISWSELTLSQ